MKKISALALVLSSLFFALPSTQARADAGKVAWDNWYTVTINKIPAEYYNEKVILHGDKIQFLSHVWRKEEGYINEEQLGAFAKADPELTPLFFNYRSTYRTTETVVDGTVHNGRNLVCNVRKAGERLPTVNKSISKNTFFSVFFPVWLRKVVPSLKMGQEMSFSTILEDDIEHGFESETGLIYLVAPDDFAKQSGTKKILVDYRSVKSYWWVEKSGEPIRTFMPETNAVIDRVSKEKAEAFLK